MKTIGVILGILLTNIALANTDKISEKESDTISKQKEIVSAEKSKPSTNDDRLNSNQRQLTEIPGSDDIKARNKDTSETTTPPTLPPSSIIRIIEEGESTKLIFNKAENAHGSSDTVSIKATNKGNNSFTFSMSDKDIGDKIYSYSYVRVYLNTKNGNSSKSIFNNISSVLGLNHLEASQLSYGRDFVQIKGLQIDDLTKLAFTAYVGELITDIELKSVKKSD